MLVPGDAPVTTPVKVITVATVVLPLVHVPPPAALPSAVVTPIHTCNVPVMPNGARFTVTVAVAVHP